MLWYTLPIVSFTASAAPPAWLITAAPTRFTRSTGDCRRFLLPLELRLALLRAPAFFAPRAVGRFALLFRALPFFAPRAEGRRDEDFFAPPRLDELRFALDRLLPFFAEARFELERLPRFDLALLAMSVTSSEGGAGRIRNFRAQARAGSYIPRASPPSSEEHRCVLPPCCSP
jgi:hypothetical protein